MAWKSIILVGSLLLNVCLFLTRQGSPPEPNPAVTFVRAEPGAGLTRADPEAESSDRTEAAKGSPDPPKDWVVFEGESGVRFARRKLFVKDSLKIRPEAAGILGIQDGNLSKAQDAIDATLATIKAGENQRVQKNSDWHYSIPPLESDQAKQIREELHEAFAAILDPAQVGVFDAVTSTHPMLFQSVEDQVELQMQPYRDHLEVKLLFLDGFLRSTTLIRYDEPYDSHSWLERYAHLVDFESMRDRAHEETASLRAQ